MKAFSLPYPTEPVPDLNDLSRLTQVEAIEPHLTLYTTVLWHVSLKRKIRLALLLDTRNPNKPGYVLLFSTNVDLDAKQILDYYKARFQIEFIFRDAKQFGSSGFSMLV